MQVKGKAPRYFSCLVQDRSDKDDGVVSAATGAGDTLIMSGFTEGSVSGWNTGDQDLCIGKLDGQGNMIWSFHVGHVHTRSIGQRKYYS